MPYVDEDWIVEYASSKSKKIGDIHTRVDGAEPVDGSVSGEEYQDARSFVRNIKHASEMMKDAYYEVVDADKKANPTPFVAYEAAYTELQEAATADLPDVPAEWRTEMDDARAELQEILANCPRP